jgi:NAD(P)H-flavin reductase/hemoglobin-like flavoprotein
MAYFFATLFLRNPELRPLFPLAMDGPRQRVFGALTRYAWGCDQPESLTRWLRKLAHDHRKYGVTEDHYRPFCAALLAALRTVSGRAWTPDVEAAWEGALSHISTIMTDAAGSAGDAPAWLLAEVAEHDQRRPDLAVISLRPEQDGLLPYRPGQHISLQVPRWPRVWREYSIANAPRPDGLLHLHVRAIPGGRVSGTLVHRIAVGDTVIIGRARGDMTAEAAPGGGVVCVAGGTGLAPIKAVAEALTRPDRQPPVSVRLLFGARQEDDLYDLADLQRLAASCPALEVIPVVGDDPHYDGVRGSLPQVAARLLPPATSDVFISGPPGMVSKTVTMLASRSAKVRIHFDPQPDPG